MGADMATEALAAAEGAKPRRVRNISDLAKLAGVSAGTVSRALAGKDLVNVQTRERIQALAREHGFSPNQMASRLRTGHTGVIGLVVPLGREQKHHLSDPFCMALLAHIAEALGERGYDLMLSRVVPEHEEEWLSRIVDSGMLDGVLMLGQSDQFDTIERVAGDYLPLVVWGTHREGQRHCAVGTDGFAGGKLAAEHLVASGKRKLAFLGEPDCLESDERLAGAEAAADEASPSASVSAWYVRPADGDLPAQIGAALDQMDPATDGIFASNDVIAMAALRILHDRGRRVPLDIALVGFDDLPLLVQAAPQLTTVRQDIAAGAKAMVGSLLRRIGGEDTPSTVLKPKLMARLSA